MNKDNKRLGYIEGGEFESLERGDVGYGIKRDKEAE